MNLDLGGWAIGWREAVIGLIVMVAGYMLFVVLRMRRLSRPQPAAPAPMVPVPEAAVPLPPAEAVAAPAWPESPQALAQEAFMRGVEGELAQLREELDALRGEVSALRQDWHQEMAGLRATQSASPIYTDAMQMARMGHDAQTIAERCGIARAEAELVVALVNNQNL